jgi:hypothetical protein
MREIFLPFEKRNPKKRKREKGDQKATDFNKGPFSPT